METKTIIKGALYFNGDEILRPHFSGQFHTVDCTQYFTKKHIKENYSKEFYKEATGKDANYIEYGGVKYYQCEYSPYHTDGMELLSDLSELEFFDNETEF